MIFQARHKNMTVKGKMTSRICQVNKDCYLKDTVKKIKMQVAD